MDCETFDFVRRLSILICFEHSRITSKARKRFSSNAEDLARAMTIINIKDARKDSSSFFVPKGDLRNAKDQPANVSSKHVYKAGKALAGHIFYDRSS